MNELQTFVLAWFKKRETKSVLAGPPPKASSYKRDNEVLNQVGNSLGVEQCVQT